ncbi:C-C motif chemokine 3-like [Tenrec ecaudatus]|uniref:C-C motif chemokine 3-like n=1 Tax=Tenrec ecaudatus TaxID=94439 RepID=UPI003F591E01
MKVPVVALASLLCLATLCAQVFSAPAGADTPSACCFAYASRKIQRKFVVDYYETNSLCSEPGIIFITKKNRQVCANPSEAWVQEYVTSLELNA